MPAGSAESSNRPGSGRPPFSPKAELTLTRVFDAPRDLVFRVWTDPKHVTQWWGPQGFTTTMREMQVRAGGAWRYDMRGPDGKVYPFDGTYVEVVPPERLVFDGAIHDSPAQRVWTEVTFTERGQKTEVAVHQWYSFESDATRYAELGWNQQLDRLREFLRVINKEALA